MLLRHSKIQYGFTNIGHARAHGKQPPLGKRVGVSACRRVGVWEEVFGAAGEFCFPQPASPTNLEGFASFAG